jgi:MtN3 and saliva related transmembrane protein
VTAIDLLGTIAGILTTIAFLPQVLKVWRSRSAKDISLGMYAIFAAGVACWVIYGWILSMWPVMIANVVTLALVAVVIALKLRWG